MKIVIGTDGIIGIIVGLLCLFWFYVEKKDFDAPPAPPTTIECQACKVCTKDHSIISDS